MRKSLAVMLMVVTVFGFSTKEASAAPVSLTLTLTDQAGAGLFIAAIGGAVTSSIPFEISGTIDVTLDDAIDDLAGTNDTTSINLDGAQIFLSDETLNLSLGFLGGVSAGLDGLEITTLQSASPIALTTTNPTNPFEYNFDPGGGNPTELAIGAGLFTYNGTGALGGALGSGTIDFSTEPLSAEIPSVGAIGLLTQTVTVTGSTVVVDVVVSAPLSFSDEILTDPVDVIVDLTGALVATGSYTTIIPEPSTMVLLGVALVGLIPMWRRLRK